MDEDIRNLLTSWDLEEYIELFKQNNITSLSLSLLSESMIKDLFPLIGPRAIFSKNLEIYKSTIYSANSINQSIGDDLSIGDILTFPLDVSNFTSTPKSKVVSIHHSKSPLTYNQEDSPALCDYDLRSLLEATLEGKGLLNLNKTQPLNNAARHSLVKIICTSILHKDPQLIVRSSVYANWSRVISDVFPLEKQSVFFHTKIVQSTRGVVTRLAGKLPDQIHNLKRKYRECGLVTKRRRTSTPAESSQSPCLRLPDDIPDCMSDVEESSSESNLLWLQNSTEPWTTVEIKWGQTTQHRLIASKQLSIDEYLNKYCALRKPKGYLLLEKDFNFLYGGKFTDITESFPPLKKNIFKLAKNRNNKDKYYELLLNYEEDSEETTNIAGLMLIPMLLSVSNIRLKNKTKKVWRPSKVEVAASFINHVKSDSDIIYAVNSKQVKFKDLGLTVQPYIIIVGESLESITSYFVVINDIFYSVSNILSAVSLCFKIIWVINAQYPIECHSTWMFIQETFFKFETKYDSNSTAALTLSNELEKLSS